MQNMIKLVFLGILAVTVMIAVSLPVKAQTVYCDSVSWVRPSKYATGDDMPEARPNGYKVYFSDDKLPTKENAIEILETVGARETKVDIPAKALETAGQKYVRVTAYNIHEDEGKQYEIVSEYSEAATFLASGGKCHSIKTPGIPTDVEIKFQGTATITIQRKR